MKCEHVRHLIADHVESRLLPLDREAVDAHLRGCASCRREAAALRALARALDALPDPEVPDGFADAVMDRLPEMLPKESGAGHLVRWGLFAAATLAAFVAGVLLLPRLGGADVARATLQPLSLSLRLGGTLLAQSTAALGAILDAAAAALLATGLDAQIAFVVLFLACTGAFMVTVRRCRAVLGEEPAVERRRERE